MPDGPKPFRSPAFLALLASLTWRPVTGARLGGTTSGAQLGTPVSPSGSMYALHLDPGDGEGTIVWALGPAATLSPHRQRHLMTEASFAAARAGAVLAMDWDGVRAVATAVG